MFFVWFYSGQALVRRKYTNLRLPLPSKVTKNLRPPFETCKESVTPLEMLHPQHLFLTPPVSGNYTTHRVASISGSSISPSVTLIPGPLSQWHLLFFPNVYLHFLYLTGSGKYQYVQIYGHYAGS
jgi:hypothetical protein